LVVAGGVAANRALRSHLTAVCGRAGIAVHPVAPAYCTDNAAMVAGLGESLLLAGHRDDPHTLDALPTGQVRRSTAPQGS
jgi:N6-L-threonylcarbamoyladenine synthase